MPPMHVATIIAIYSQPLNYIYFTRYITTSASSSSLMHLQAAKGYLLAPIRSGAHANLLYFAVARFYLASSRGAT